MNVPLESNYLLRTVGKFFSLLQGKSPAGDLELLAIYFIMSCAILFQIELGVTSLRYVNSTHFAVKVHALPELPDFDADKEHKRADEDNAPLKPKSK